MLKELDESLWTGFTLPNISVAGSCKHGNENSGSIKWGKLCLACLEGLCPIVLGCC